MVTLISAGFGLAVTLIGIPILLLTIYVGRLIGVVERARVRLLLGVAYRGRPMPDLRGNLWKKFLAIIGDGPGWGGIGYGFVMLPWGIFTFVVTIVGCGWPPWAASRRRCSAGGRRTEFNGTVIRRGRGGVHRRRFVGGVLLLVAMPWVIRGFANADTVDGAHGARPEPRGGARRPG